MAKGAGLWKPEDKIVFSASDFDANWNDDSCFEKRYPKEVKI